MAAVSTWGFESPPCWVSSAHGSAWECPHRGWMHSLNQQTTDPGVTQGGMVQGGRPPIPLQGKEAVLGAGQGVRESQGSVALLVAVWHYLGSESWVSLCLRNLDAVPIHQLVLPTQP